MQVYLAEPGGPIQGPYTLEQVNADLTAREYSDEHFWAWHDGLTGWVPLYSVGGISGAADTTMFFAQRASETSKGAANPPEPPGPDTTIFLAKPPWFQAVQQAAEANELQTPVQPELPDSVLTGTERVREESQSPGESQTAEATPCAAPTPIAEEPPKELEVPAPATVQLSTAGEPLLAPLDSKSTGHIAAGAAKAVVLSRRNTAATRRLSMPKAPPLRGSRKSARPTRTPRGVSTSRRRMKSVAGGALIRRKFLATELLATATGRESPR